MEAAAMTRMTFLASKSLPRMDLPHSYCFSVFLRYF